MARKKKCREKPCKWEHGHSGPHSFPCETCREAGIVAFGEEWARCIRCKGRGWIDVKKTKAPRQEKS